MIRGYEPPWNEVIAGSWRKGTLDRPDYPDPWLAPYARFGPLAEERRLPCALGGVTPNRCTPRVSMSLIMPSREEVFPNPLRSSAPARQNS